MSNEYLIIEKSRLEGEVKLAGAKNAVLVTMASLILTEGVSTLTNVPFSQDIKNMVLLLEQLGAKVIIDSALNTISVDTCCIDKWTVSYDLMKKMRASILVMGPLLARFGKAEIGLPGGCVIGTRPIDYHLANFERMGAQVEIIKNHLCTHAPALQSQKLVLEYPSVGATENILMAATLTKGTTQIINAALEPEVLDLVSVLCKMGANIEIKPPATILIKGVDRLKAVNHAVMCDRLEAGSLLLAAAVTGGKVYLPNARVDHMDLFLLKLEQMGHIVERGMYDVGVRFTATNTPKAVSYKTAPYPGFPTDLQAPMMLAQCLADGTSVVEETVFENRLIHVREFQKMGAQISVKHNKATITGVEKLYGTSVIGTDIRAGCALVLAGLCAEGTTVFAGVHHLRRGYENIEQKLQLLGAKIHTTLLERNEVENISASTVSYSRLSS